MSLGGGRGVQSRWHGWRGEWADSGARNEPDFQTPYLYHYINKQWKSVNQSRALARQLYVLPLTMPSSASSSTSERMLIDYV